MAAQLVAYLDGELDSEASSVVERRLSEDADYRRALRQLQRSWDLLDHLPQADVDETFTQSTVALVALQAADDVDRAQTRRTNRERWFGLVGAGSALAAFVAGYLIVTTTASRSNRALLRDLPVIERLDEYRYVDDVEFLRMLHRAGLFPEEEMEDDL
jgi:anti-sigma factor RsiW